MLFYADGSIVYTDWVELFSNPQRLDLSTFEISQSVDKFKEMMFVTSRASGSMVHTSIVLPVSLIKTLTNSNDISIVGYGDDHMYFRYSNETSFSKDGNTALRMVKIYGR